MTLQLAKRYLLYWIAAAILATAVAVAATSPTDTLLAELRQRLLAVGVPVADGFDPGRPPSQPQMMPLSSVPRGALSAASAEGWMAQFAAGAIGGVVGIKDPPVGSQTASESALIEAWRRTPAEKQLFVSFARPDVTTAQVATQVLRDRGYFATVYLNEPGAAPLYKPEIAGYLYGTAHHKVLLDSVAARAASGVYLEVAALDALADRGIDFANVDSPGVLAQASELAANSLSAFASLGATWISLLVLGAILVGLLVPRSTRPLVGAAVGATARGAGVVAKGVGSVIAVVVVGTFKLLAILAALALIVGVPIAAVIALVVAVSELGWVSLFVSVPVGVAVAYGGVRIGRAVMSAVTVGSTSDVYSGSYSSSYSYSNGSVRERVPR